MRYLIVVMLMALANVAGAVECQIYGSPWIDMDRNPHIDYEVYIRSSITPADGGKIMMDPSLWCRGAPSGERLEIWTTYDPVRLTSRFAHYKSGLKSNGVYFPSPASFLLLGKEKPGNTLALADAVPYVVVDSPPNGYIEIPAGEKILTFEFEIRVLRGTTLVRSIYPVIHMYAQNSLNLNPSTCTINNNAPIDVDFGSVDPVAIGGDIPAGTPYRQSKTLNYSCPDRGINSPIDIKLVGTASSFNSSALSTTNPDLAVGMHRLSALVRPGGSFRTSVRNSSGSDTVLFTLFRKSGSFPTDGPFTGSATLVMSVP